MSVPRVRGVSGDASQAAEHEFTRAHLPGHVTQTLDSIAARRVSEHLAVCAQCRAELECDRALADIMATAPVLELAPQAGLARVMARIAARESRRARLWGWLRPLLGEGAQRPLLFTVAVQAAAIVVLVCIVALPARTPPPAQFRTLSNPAMATAMRGARIRVVFDDAVTLAQLQRLLAPLGAQIVALPDTRGGLNGPFTVQLPGAAGPALQVLRSDPAVRFAEQVRE